MKTIHLSLFISSLLIVSHITGAYATSIKASAFGWNATDATTAFQNAINSSYDTTIVDMQAGDWVVRPNTFTNLSNKTIIFQSGVVLLAKPGAFTNTGDCLLRFNQANNVKIYGYGAVLKMQKAEYTTGEWRMALSLISCSNTSVFGLKVMDSGGDGVYVAGNNGVTQNYCENVLLKDIWSDNNRRQGISVISARHLRVEHCWFTNTIGTLPEFGIDLEPNDSTERLVDVVFDKCRITGNNGSAIGISVLNLNNTSLPLDITFSNCYLSNNHTTSNAYVACEIQLGDNGKSTAVSGAVNFNTCMIENSQWTAVCVRKTAYGYQANFNNCVFKDVSQNTTFSQYNNPIWVEVTDYNIACPRFGGAVFNNCLLSYGTAYNFLDSYGNASTSAGMGDVQLNNVTVINPNTVTYNATRGGGSPSTDCIFTTQKYTAAPATTVSYTAGGHLIECNTTNSILNTTRAAGSNVSYPLGISYAIHGTGIQGFDYSRMNGFEIIPEGTYSQTDTFLVLKDTITEAIKNDTVTINTSANYTTPSSAQPIIIQDCGSTGTHEISNPKVFPISDFIVKFVPYANCLYIELDEELKAGSTIRIFNCLGNKVADLTDRFHNNRSVRISLGHASGVYFIKFQNRKTEFDQKIIWDR